MTLTEIGEFLNLSTSRISHLDKITKYIRKINRIKSREIETDIDVIPNSENIDSDRAYKYTNYEKNILKQYKLKKILNEDKEYDIMKFCDKNISSKTKSKSKSKTSKKTTKNKTVNRNH